MLQLPEIPKSANERALASFIRERFTGLTTTTVTLSNTPLSGFESVFKNGVLLDPNTYTISGQVITLGSALTGTDVVQVKYYFKAGS